MTARDIQRAIMRERWMQAIAFPNYTPPKWWECDIFELTKAGYFREYEIKISRSDFRADAKKGKRAWESLDIKARTKHSELALGNPVGPAQFWFVAPVGIIPIEEIPEFAGLMEAVPYPTSGFYFETRKNAPRLHSVKADEKIRNDLMRTAYFRFQSMTMHSRLWVFDPTEDEPDFSI